MDAGLLAKSFQDLISSAFSSCQTSSLLRTEGRFFTLVLLNCDAPGMLQMISQAGKIIHRSITDQEGLMPGASAEELGLHLPLALLAACPTQHALGRVSSSLHGAIIAPTCSLGSHSADLETRHLGVLRMIQTRIPNSTQCHGVSGQKKLLICLAFPVGRAQICFSFFDLRVKIRIFIICEL